jgi:16S rRNA (cytosine1402-N4)-methyltransferase
MNYHIPVLLHEAIQGLKISKGKRFIDATFGGGGHSKHILEEGGEVLAIDTDSDALKEAQSIHDTKFKIHQGNFQDIEQIAEEEQFSPVDGVLFDLGVSSHQLDEENRGFSYKYPDAVFDLRLNQHEGIPASELINHETEDRLATIIGTYGEEEHCRSIAHIVVHSRMKNPIKTTGDVLRIVEKAVGAGIRNETASRVFQAFRIAVNDELGALKKGLIQAEHILSPGGRIAVISFHSLEDRIVKQFFLKPEFRVITKKPIIPSEKEIMTNRRSRSAKLRIAEKL